MAKKKRSRRKRKRIYFDNLKIKWSDGRRKKEFKINKGYYKKN